jgi:hypothetical protein
MPNKFFWKKLFKYIPVIAVLGNPRINKIAKIVFTFFNINYKELFVSFVRGNENPINLRILTQCRISEDLLILNPYSYALPTDNEARQVQFVGVSGLKQ